MVTTFQYLNFPDWGSIFGDFKALSQYNSYQLVGGGAGQLPNQVLWKVFIESVEATYYYSNYTEGAAEMDIYDLHVKRDTNVLPETFVNQGLAERNILSQASPAGTNTYFGIAPGESSQFRTFYKTDKVTKITMPPGGTHKHIVKYHVNKWMPCEKVLKSPVYSANGLFGNITYNQMCVLRGYPAKLTGSGTVVDLASNVVWTVTEKVHWRLAPFETSMVDALGTLNTTGTAVDVLLDSANIAANVAQILL